MSYSYVGERFDSLDTRFAGMDIRLTQLEEDVGYIRQSFDLPPPPPPSQNLVYNSMSLISRVFWLCYLDYYFQYFIYLLVFGFQTFMLWFYVFLNFKLIGFYFGYVLFMILVGYDL